MTKRFLTWHTVFNLYCIAVVITDVVDISLNWYLNRYRLQVNLLADRSVDSELAVIVSDALILPFIAIIFCYYYSILKKKWVVPIAAFLVLFGLELTLVLFRSMQYIRWDVWVVGEAWIVQS
jgi:hypothetical protein